MNQTTEVLETVKTTTRHVMNLLEQGIETETLVKCLNGYSEALKQLKLLVPAKIYKDYAEFFEAFHSYCSNASGNSITEDGVNNIYSSLALTIECLAEIIQRYSAAVKVCPCCGREVVYNPLGSYYSDMIKKSGREERHGQSETLNHDEYLCPDCGSSDRDRMIVSFMHKNNLTSASPDRAVLQVAPAKSIENWILRNCPQVRYETTDLFMDGVDYKSDIQDLKEIEDKRFDLIICSHVLEHVKDDQKAMAAMKRVLKDDGKIAFLVPIDLMVEEIDEEWGLSEQENWRRFGQGDHCRNYSKKGLIERLSRYFHVTELGKDYFGEETFTQCGLTDTSTLYLLTKDASTDFDLGDDYVTEEVPTTGPVVSVVMSAYNHGRFVAEAIESVLNQTYQNIEFLVADDGSSDNTAEVMKHYSGRFAHEAYFDDNEGSRTAYLLSKSTGKYIALMHSDDVWEPEKIALQVKYLEEHPECGVCFSWCQYTDDDLNPIYDNTFIQRNRTRAEWLRFFFEKENALSNPSSLIRRELYCGVNFVGCETRQLSDLYKWINMVQKHDIHIVQKVLIKMRRHNVTATVNNVSSMTQTNILRHHVEQGAHWIVIIKNMNDDLFREAFGSRFIDKDAEGTQIKCEKYFLLKNAPNPYVRYSALAYLAEIYPETKEIFEEKYSYTRYKVWDEETEYFLSLNK